jgi:hypothetical protein
MQHNPRVVFRGWPLRQLARAKATLSMGGEHRAKECRFGTLVHQIYGIQPGETGF